MFNITDVVIWPIKIDYEVLPCVTDVMEAAIDDAPLLHEDLITRGVEPAPTKPSNVSKVVNFGILSRLVVVLVGRPSCVWSLCH